MPRQRQPPALRKASMENIVCHFEDFWCAGTTSDLLEYSEQSDVFTPFQYLCHGMVQEIIDMLTNRELLRPHHFQLLLHSNIRRLDLVRVDLCRDVYHHNDIIKTIGTRCQKLTHLSLAGLRTVQTEHLCTLVRNLPQIVSLCLHHTTIGASVIKTISENCPNLLELDLEGCSLEDKCLLYLCNYPKDAKARPQLRKLYVNGIVSTDTVVQLLKNQTRLQCLGTYCCIEKAIEQMYGEEFRSSKEVPPELVHNLLDITIDRSSLPFCKADPLNLTFQCCPFLTKLTLVGLRKGEPLNKVAKLKHLKTLIVSMDRCSTRWPVLNDQNLSKYMAPLLSKIGDNLTCLEFWGFDEVSLILIGSLCLKLESLVLHNVSLISEQHPKDGDVTQWISYFTNLKVINIDLRLGPRTDLDANVLCVLLQNATKLEDCTFVNVINMTDSVISKANRKHGFRYLKKSRFQSCSSISMDSLWVLLSPDNPLERLSVDRCENITSRDIYLIRQEAELRQFNIDIWPHTTIHLT